MRSIHPFILFSLVILPSSLAQADIFRWDNGELIQGTEGVSIWSDLSGFNLAYADLRCDYEICDASFSNANLAQSDLSNSHFGRAKFDGANLTGANLYGTYLQIDTMHNADLSGATIQRAYFIPNEQEGLTSEQLYATRSYQLKDLHGVRIIRTDMRGWSFADQDLSDGQLDGDLTNADLTGAVINGARIRRMPPEQLYSRASYRSQDLRRAQIYFPDDVEQSPNLDLIGQDLTKSQIFGLTSDADVSDAVVAFSNLGLTEAQLYSTVSYKRKDLRGMLFRKGVQGWDLNGQDLSGAQFYSWSDGFSFDGTDFSDAMVKGTDFRGATTKGFLTDQLYSTASYQARDLRGIWLGGNNMSGWDFSGIDLTNATLSWTTPNGTGLESRLNGANFKGASLTNATVRLGDLSNADLSDANVRGADFRGSAPTPEQIYSTTSYQSGDLSGIKLGNNDLSDWDFSGQDLTEADLRGANLTGANFDNADLTGANLIGAEGFSPSVSTITRNTISRVSSFKLLEGDRLLISRPFRHWSDEVYVSDRFHVADGAIVEIDIGCHILGGCSSHGKFVIDEEDATISLGGTLRISVAGTPEYWRNYSSRFSLNLFDWIDEDDDDFELETEFTSIELPAGRWDVSKLYINGEIRRLESYRDNGDLNVDDRLDSHDMDQLSIAVRNGRDLSYDLNRDQLVDQGDRSFWIHDIIETWYGDSNLDGEFNSGDLVGVFQAGHYEDDIAMNSGWAEGDWNGDGDFATSDLVFAFQDGGYERGPWVEQAVAVPEPCTSMWIIVAVTLFANYQRCSCFVERQRSCS